MKTLFTILMMSILLSFSYAQKHDAKHLQEQSPRTVSENFIDHPDKMIKMIGEQFRKNQNKAIDFKQKLDSILREYHPEASWEQSSINYFEYDEKGNNIIDNKIRVRDPGSYLKNEFSYDSLGRVISTISESVFEGMEKDIMSFKVEYHDSLKYISTLMKEWDETQQEFFNVYLSEVYYSDTNFVIPSEHYDSAFVSEWNIDTQKWERFSKETISILENGYESIEYQYMLEDWKVVAKTEVIVSDEETTSIWSQYDYQTEIWTLESKNIDLYEDGNVIQSNSFYWNATDEIWDAGSREEYVFNFDYSLIDLVLPFDNEFFITSNNMITHSETMQWFSSSEEWISNGRESYHYSAFSPTGIESDFEVSTIQIYPNPAHDFLKVEISSMEKIEAEIYNIHGSLLQTETVNSNDIIHIENLKPGVYLLKLKGGSEMQTQKFIKK